MENIIWLLLRLLAVFTICDAAKILAIFPLPAKSHGILSDAIVKHLLSAGHEVTFITTFPKNGPNPKLHEVDVSKNFKLMEEKPEYMNIESILNGESSVMDPSIHFILMNDMTRYTVENENVQNLLKDKMQHFDLVIAEWMYNELYAGFAGIYSAPLIWFSTMEPHWMILNLIDDYLNPSYNPNIIDDSPPFTFAQRIYELIFTIKIAFVRETVGNYLQTSAYNSLLVPHIEARGKVAPSFSELRFNASIVLGNSHVSLGHSTRLPQGYKAIGGYHVDKDVKPLPEDLKKILDNAKHGAIYFSMGSALQSKHMPDKLKKSLLEVFGSLKQTVLWKFEEKFLSLPNNVHILGWAPQQSILAHPNCVLFITHGGLLSTTETVHVGKPIIGIPVFADQFGNVAKAVNRGYARRVELSHSMADHLKIEIAEILGNPKYAQKAKELSYIYHDRPVSPSQELVHWVNHVLNTGGAPHLRSAALLVPWYQKYYIDLAIIFIIAIITLLKITKLLKSVLKPNEVKNSKKCN